MKKISFDKFEKKYKPVKNHLVEDAPEDGLFFETFGEEEQYVKKTAQETPNRVWTILTGLEDGDTMVTGYHFVNRLGYIITEVPFADRDIEIEISMEGD